MIITRILFALPLVACSVNRPIDASTASAGSESAPAGGRAWIAAKCARMLGERLPVASVEEMQAAIRRRWALCSAPGIFDSPREQGIEIGADDRYALLAWSGDTLARESGLENEGSVTYEDTSAYIGMTTIQVNFNADGEYFIPTIPVISDDDPPMMFLGDFETAKYLAIP